MIRPPVNTKRRQTNSHRDKRTYRQAGRQTDKQIDSHATLQPSQGSYTKSKRENSREKREHEKGRETGRGKEREADIYIYI